MPEPSDDDTRRELRTDEGALRYHEVGEGPPLLLLHGSGPGVTGLRNFRGSLETLAQHFRCLVLEFPGYGVSDPTDDHPFVAAPKAALRLLDGLGIEQLDMIGNSMGGIVAVNLEMARAGVARRIVTVGGVGTPLLSPTATEGIRLLVEFTEDPTRDALVRWLHSMVHDPAVVTEEMIEERWAQATEPATLATARRMYSREAMAAAATQQPPYWSMLHKVAAPTLLTWGRDDRVTPVDMALLPMRTMPKAELHILPNCGHWAMIEQRAAWESAVLSFLTRPQQA